MSTETATEFAVGTKVQVTSSPYPKTLPNGTTAEVIANLGPDDGDPVGVGGTGDRLFIKTDDDTVPVYASEVEPIEEG